ncbi:MAG TPA: DegT/DnrJ/EryC1/StrS family aminotransferase [Candidatus Acidoferrum sp.]|nr:DegT/DnrJ/EryC1/StrS family aminotransferase [Candidatus Acidoferrum sp.]
MNVPFLNLAAQYESLKSELLPVVEKTLAAGHYVLGPNVSALEQEIATYTATKFGIGVNSGSDALTLALRALEIGPGDEVITTPFTYIAPAESIHQVGAKIVFADIHPRTFNVDPAEIEKKITPRTKAIIPVHLFGQAAPMAQIMALAQARGIHVIEDCAQAIGATYNDKPVGSFGAVGCFSFYPTKNLGANGDAGMIVTSDEALAKKLRMLRVHGIERRYFHDLHGYNSRLDELQAAILRVKLPHLKRWNARRAEIARYYTQALDHLPLEFPVTAKENNHVFHVYALLTNRRDALQKFLADRGVPSIIYYPRPLHLQQLYTKLGHKAGDFPVAEKISELILPLPMYPELTREHVDQVVGAILGFFSQP